MESSLVSGLHAEEKKGLKGTCCCQGSRRSNRLYLDCTLKKKRFKRNMMLSGLLWSNRLYLVAR